MLALKYFRLKWFYGEYFYQWQSVAPPPPANQKKRKKWYVKIYISIIKGAYVVKYI